MPTKVLVVDDNAAVCEFIREVLISEKMQAYVFTDSAQAAARLRDERFDVVFLDMRMSPPDGIELARQIRSSGPNKTTPLVMITGENDYKLMQRAFQVGVNFFLFKPADRARLMRLLRAADNFINYEKRRCTRVGIRRAVSIECGEHQLSGTTLDLSLGGMLVQTSYTLPVGSTVRVSLNFKPGTPPLRLAARVVRALGDHCVGLQIENAPEVGKALENFLLPLILAESDQISPGASAV